MGKKKKSRTVHTAPGADMAVSDRVGVTEVVLDDVEIQLDLSVLRDLRIMRRIRNDDQDAILDFYERLFPDQLDELEDVFELSDVDDYNQLLKRCMESANPN